MEERVKDKRDRCRNRLLDAVAGREVKCWGCLCDVCALLDDVDALRRAAVENAAREMRDAQSEV
jgi:hypothetical protein